MINSPGEALEESGGIQTRNLSFENILVALNLVKQKKTPRLPRRGGKPGVPKTEPFLKRGTKKKNDKGDCPH